MRRIVLLTLGVLVALALSACGGGNATTQQAPANLSASLVSVYKSPT